MSNQKYCLQCGIPITGNATKKYCSSLCKSRHNFPAAKIHTDVCLECGKTYTKLGKVKKEFCSAKCRKRYRERKNILLAKSNIKQDISDDVVKKINAVSSRWEYIEGYKGCESIITLRCKDCGNYSKHSAGMIRKSRSERHIDCYYCTQIIKNIDKNNKEKEKSIKIKAKEKAKADKFWQQKFEQISMINCIECDALINKGKFCSENCRKRYNNRKKEISRRTMLQKQVIDKDISLEKLYKRDKGICYICGCKCNWNDFEIINNNRHTGKTYPTIEHIKPLSKGGSHSWNNVKIACFECNTKKGSKYG